jgi:DNA polymerase V
MKDEEVKLTIYLADLSTELSLPYADGGIKAGFPSPAQDYLTESIDLNKTLIRHPETTFYAKVAGDSLTNAGICDMDLAIIDRSLECQNGDYVAAYVDGEFTLKQFKLDEANNCAWLIPANEKYDPIKITEDNQFLIWGVITSVIKRFHKF